MCRVESVHLAKSSIARNFIEKLSFFDDFVYFIKNIVIDCGAKICYISSTIQSVFHNAHDKAKKDLTFVVQSVKLITD